jgi:hypothetical protein
MKDKHITIFEYLEQGSEEWLSIRSGILTASVMHKVMTSNYKIANNETSRGLLNELAAQRITGHIEPTVTTAAMQRGHDDEPFARITYSDNYAEVTEVGFILNTSLLIPLGYSPDGLVGEDGLIEIKSKMPKFHIDILINQKVPDEHVIQCQMGLFVSGRQWLDFISYSAGLPMVTIRMERDEDVISAIKAAAIAFDAKLEEKVNQYEAALNSGARLIPTDRRVEDEEIFV